MLDPDFGASLIDGGKNSPFYLRRIMGVRLRKFCLWHMLLLRAVESPYLCKGKVRPFDLRTLIGICRNEFGNSRIRRPWWYPVIGKKQLVRINNRALEYVGDYLRQPEFSVVQSPGKAFAPKIPRGQPPRELRTVCNVMAMTHCSRREAWEMPIGEAYWYEAMAIREKVPIEFVDEEEREFRRAMADAKQQKTEDRGRKTVNRERRTGDSERMTRSEVGDQALFVDAPVKRASRSSRLVP